MIDDYSTVRLWEDLPETLRDQIRIIQNLGAKGQGGALNYAISQMRYDYFLFTDSDCVVQEDWVSVSLAALRSDVRVDGVAGPNWCFQTAGDPWTAFLTRNERNLMNHYFSRFLDADRNAAGRIDLRNFGARFSFLYDNPFPEGVVSVSGYYSYLLQKKTQQKARIQYLDDMITRHDCVRSLRRQVHTYFQRAHDVNVLAIYTRNFSRSLLNAFSDLYLKRHFIDPVRNGVSPVYVIAVHGAFWLGLALCAFERRRYGSR